MLKLLAGILIGIPLGIVAAGQGLTVGAVLGTYGRVAEGTWNAGSKAVGAVDWQAAGQTAGGALKAAGERLQQPAQPPVK